jgi:hypothetical protein
MERSLPQVGAPDPELQTSPIVDEAELDEQAGARDIELEQGVCYFNGTRFSLGTYVQSGSELLKCAEGGVWVRVAEREGTEI